jgi:hypothetical protein
LVFSEIMYHPVDAVTNILDGDEYEFVELHNAGPTAYSLSGAQFTSGITYTFTNGASLAPSQYLAVVRNRAAFTNRYPSVANIAASNFTGSLANGGEKVTLKSFDGTTIFSVTYMTDTPWPSWPDGHGSSLQLRGYDSSPDDGTNWCASALLHGTPGSAGVRAAADVVINEVLAHTDPPQEDAVELFNTSTNAVSIGGWYLSDDPAVRKKFRITNAVIAARGFAVIYEHQFQTNALFDTNNIPFELSSDQGDRVYLTAADASSNLTRIVDVQVFEASANGVSFGLYPNGTGSFVTLSGVTLGATNSAPKIGPVVISEVMYHPASDNPDEEYIELLNISTSSVPLFLGTNTWKLSTAVDFLFPANVVIGPTQRVLVVGTTNFGAFRALYGVSANVAVYGPWAGQLNNAGESIRLYQPDTPNADGFVPYLLVDRVDYGDAAPWPTAPDGNGPSLERAVTTNLGIAADNWYSGAPGGSPGAAPAGGFVNPRVAPSTPAAGQTFTVTVSVVAGALPTQVVLRTSINGIVSNRVMRDDGTGPDAVAGDQMYSAALVAPTNEWVYYRFAAHRGGVEVFVSPSPGTRFVPAPALYVGDCNTAISATVQPSQQWTTYVVTGSVGHADCFQVYLNAAGEVLVDDVTMIDGGGTNHLANSSFTTSISPWNINTGNHETSSREVLDDEGGNGVLHVRATGSGNTPGNFYDSVSVGFSPTMTVGQSASMSFRARQVSYRAETWFFLLVGEAPPDVVINEIMYHPEGTNDPAHEYVEFHNRSGAPVNMTGWILEGVGDFLFPSGSVIAAGGYLVAAANAPAVSAAYGISNAVGNWSGSLQNSGETVMLLNAFGRPVDSIAYDDEEPWPVAADGFGPSLERLNPASPGSTSVNWQSSAADAGWRQVVWTGQVSSANGGIRFFLDYDGMCWIDDVSVARPGSTNNLVPNGGFETGTTGWVFSGNHGRSRVHAGQGHGGSGLALFGNETRLIYPDYIGGELLLNGDASSNHVRSANLATTNGDTYVVSWWARRGGLGETVYSVLAGVTNAIWLGNHGTPGRANSTASTNAPLQIQWVNPSSNIVAVGATNVIRARVQSAGLVTSVVLRYRMCGTNSYQFTDRTYSSATMRDDGIVPDSAAGDGVYAAYAPVVTSSWWLVRYHVLASASNGAWARSPAADDPSLDRGFWVQGALPQTNIPNWQVLVDGNPVRYPINARCCAVSPDGQVFTDVEIRHRGRTSSSVNGSLRTGVALRMHDSRLYDAWFASDQEGINFRSRQNDHDQAYSRLVSEQLAYGLQRQLGFPTPRFRPVVAWINGSPSITVELEAPQEEFLSGNGIGASDFVSRAGYTGRRRVAGDATLDNFDAMKQSLMGAPPSARTEAIRTNLWYESVQHALAFLSAIGDADQYLDWNMFQHRNGSDGRWAQYPWDLDICFDTQIEGAFQQSTNLHPYYQTPLHPSIWDTNVAEALGPALFYPESGAGSAYTLPYRYRQQTTLWRMCHTWFTTNVIHPRVDAIQSALAPVYAQIGVSAAMLTSKVAGVKSYVASRRNFLMNRSWSDKMSLWTNTYSASSVVINEIMHSPLSGGEYIELHNPGAQPLDLSFWHVRASDEVYSLPFGTMLGPTSYLVLADTQSALTNAFAELGNPALMIERYPGYALWDFPIVFTSAAEYASRVVEVDALTLPGTGATVQVLDNFSNLMDSVSYSAEAPWPGAAGVALELIDPLAENGSATHWRASPIVGTPGSRNAAASDRDGDSMDDGWEQQIVAASGGSLPTVDTVLPGADFDGDTLDNLSEYIAGGNPTAMDAPLWKLAIGRAPSSVQVSFNTVQPTGSAYGIYSGRFYALERSASPRDAWTVVTNYANLPATGSPVSYTNPAPAGAEHFRYEVELRPMR